MNLLHRLQPPSTADGQRLLLHAVDWRTYEKFLDAVGNRRLRLTYDRGNLEIMAPSWNHEWWKRRIGFVIPLLGAELNVKVQGGGSTTFRREDVERGLEPDECFYIGAHAAQMSGPDREIDLSRDPPPDLVIEVDITRSSLDREGIYAALGVPELWRFDGESLQASRLGPDRTYILCARSLAFPSLPLPELVRLLQETKRLDESELIRPVQEWARRHASGAPSGAPPASPAAP
jgi:Uma2 family endonuclease